MAAGNALNLQRQIAKWLGTGPNATAVNFKDVGEDKRLTFDKSKLLGSGSNGTRVYLGTFRRPVTNEPQLVAIKHVQYNSDVEYRNTYREVENLQQLNHPNVVHYLYADKCEDYDIMFIALELCRGSLVDMFVHKHDVFKRPFTLRDNISCDHWGFKKDLLFGIAHGLNYVHSQGYLHRDLKPQNILVRDDSDNRYGYKAVICDFELTRKIKDGKARLSVSQVTVGTHGWMAREVLTGAKKLTRSIDVFAYGCIVHYVLSEKRNEHDMHPFGSDLQRDKNIRKSKRSSYISLTLNRQEHNCSPIGYENLGDSILADMLVDTCISGIIIARPPTNEILKHPFFWSYSEKMKCNEEMFNTFKDRFKDEDLIKSMQITWSSLEHFAFGGLVPDVWEYHNLYCERKRWARLPQTSLTDVFNYLMRLIRNLQQHYHDAVKLHPPLSSCLASGDDETLGRYFFERVPMLFPVIYMFARLYEDNNEGEYSSREETIHKLYQNTLKHLHTTHEGL